MAIVNEFSVGAEQVSVPTADVALKPTFEHLFACELPGMLRLAVGLVDIPERAEEIVQDAFEKTLIAWGRLREPVAYLRTVDDEWVIAGYFELGVEGYPAPDLSDERFTTPDGAVLPVLTATVNGFAWMVIRVPLASTRSSPMSWVKSAVRAEQADLWWSAR